MGIVGVLAASVTFRKEPSNKEKAAWIVLLTILMIADIRALYVADAEQVKTFNGISVSLSDTARKLGLVAQGLQATAEGIKITSSKMDTAIDNSKQQFDATTAEIGGVLSKERGQFSALISRQNDLIRTRAAVSRVA
jgi:hypothetical protein